jgi:hypothetical protein
VIEVKILLPEVTKTADDRDIPIAHREVIGNKAELIARSRSMFVIDPPMLIALAALISSLSAFVWSVRRKP